MSESAFEEQDSAMTQTSVGISPGSKLARAREALGMSVADVAQALRLSKKQIESIEANDYEKLPGRTFLRGFVRNYARLVNLDPDRMTAEYAPVQSEAETLEIQAPSQRISFSEHHQKPWLKWLASGVIVVALASWAVMAWLGPELTKPAMPPEAAAPKTPVPSAEMPAPVAAIKPEPATPAETVVSAQPAKPPVDAKPAVENIAPPPPIMAILPSTAQARVLLSFSGSAWVEIRDKNGKKLHSQNNPAGTQQTVEGEPPMSLVIGSSPNVKLTYKGQPVDLSAFSKADVARLTLE